MCKLMQSYSNFPKMANILLLFLIFHVKTTQVLHFDVCQETMCVRTQFVGKTCWNVEK